MLALAHPPLTPGLQAELALEPIAPEVRIDLQAVAGTKAESTSEQLTASISDTATVQPTAPEVQTDPQAVSDALAQLALEQFTAPETEPAQQSTSAPISATATVEPTAVEVQTDPQAVAPSPAELTPDHSTASNTEPVQQSTTDPVSDTATVEPTAVEVQTDPEAVAPSPAELTPDHSTASNTEPVQQSTTDPVSDTATVEPTAVEVQTDSEAVAPSPSELAPEQFSVSAAPISDTTTSQPTAAEAPRETPDLEISAAVEALSRALELQSDSVLQGISALFAAKQSAIRAIIASFEQRPTASLLNAPAQIVTAPAPAAEWVRMSRPVIAPRHPTILRLDTQIAAPQAVTLAGPCLPPQLRNLTEARDLGDKRNRKAIGFPAWVVSVGVAMSLFLCTGTLLQYINAKRDAPAAAAPDTPAVQPSKRAALAPAPAPASDALARSLEVSGLRLVAGWTSKPQVQFLIINHSSRQLPSIAIQVAVRSSESSEDAQPLLTINAVIHSLGPYQSKEVRADLDSDASPSTLADWQSLRTEIQSASRE